MKTKEVRANILIVNDRPDQLVALATVLESLQENIVMARSGEDALRQLLQHEFAVVLLDVHMPGLDGFDTASLIRQRGRSHSTPIIFITAYGQGDAQVARSYSLGAVDYIQTPIVPEILRTKVGVFVQLHKKSEELRLIAEAEHQRELDETKEKLDAETKRNLFFVLSIDLLAVAGFDGYFKQTNPAWEKVLGFGEAELKTQAFFEFAHPDDRASTLQQLETLKQGTAITYFEHRFACKDGSYKWLGWTAAPFAADQLVYIFARDITERRLAEEQIRCLNHKLQGQLQEIIAVNRELEAFSYSISHDLRAPLRSLQGFAQMLLAEHGSLLPASGRDYADRIVQSAAHMDQLLRDLLEYSRLNQCQLRPATVRLEPVLAETLETLDGEIHESGGQIEILQPLLPLKAHLPTLKQVLVNLIGNALKFVGHGVQPHIRIWTEHVESPLAEPAAIQLPPENGNSALTAANAANDGQEQHETPGSLANRNRLESPTSARAQIMGGSVRLWVADNGIGIEVDQLEKIFGLFQRVHDSEAYPGTGIGLAIVRKGVERMGGRVGVESMLGTGSRFWIELPAAPEVEAEFCSKAA